MSPEYDGGGEGGMGRLSVALKESLRVCWYNTDKGERRNGKHKLQAKEERKKERKEGRKKEGRKEGKKENAHRASYMCKLGLEPS